MNEKDLFRAALGLSSPWEVTQIEFDPNGKQLDLYLDFAKGSLFACPECGSLCPAYDTEERSWRHLNFFEHLCYLNARQPRVKCHEHGVLTINVPWARPRSGFTLLFEALVITFGQNGMTPSAISRIVGEHDTRLWRVLVPYPINSVKNNKKNMQPFS